MKYKIVLTEEQLRITSLALEEYFRLRSGQDCGFCDEFAEMGVEIPSIESDNMKWSESFARQMERRDALRIILNCFFQTAFAPYASPKYKSDNVLIAQDMWDAIRSDIGQSNWNNPLQQGPEPLPEIEKME